MWELLVSVSLRASLDALPSASRRWARPALSVGRYAVKKPTQVVGLEPTVLVSTTGPAVDRADLKPHPAASRTAHWTCRTLRCLPTGRSSKLRSSRPGTTGQARR